MQVITTKAAMRALRTDWRHAGETVALVPTMGSLHAGHLALVVRAKAAAQRVIVSVFVNPAQFGHGEDFATYPRDVDRDLALLRDAGVDAAFVPEVAEIYAPGAQTMVETIELSRILIGRQRPGHFRGVATVVAKLFNITQPEFACFGEKDYQQLVVIRQMVRDLDIPVTILGVPTVREADGLAMSSRNIRLSAGDRDAAPVIARTLNEAAAMVPSGITASRLRAWIAATLGAEPRADLQSVDIRDAETLGSISGPLARPAVILVTARFGRVMLIDQKRIDPAEAPPPDTP